MKRRKENTEEILKETLSLFEKAADAEGDSAREQTHAYLQAHSSDAVEEQAWKWASSRSIGKRWLAVATIAAAVTLVVLLPTGTLQSAPAMLKAVVAAVAREVRVQPETPEPRPAAQAPSNRAVATPPLERIAFEEASIRPGAPFPPPANGARGGGGGGGAPCSANPPPGRMQLDPRRFSIRRATLWELVALAIGPCEYLGALPLGERESRLTGGPDWVQSDKWDVEALIPESSDPLPTNSTRGYIGELQQGRSPKLQKMILTLLEERFKVVVRREMKEVPAYILTVAPGGTKFQAKDWVGYLSVVSTRRPEQPVPVGGDSTLIPVATPGAPAGGSGNPGWDLADPVVRAKKAAITQGAEGFINWESGMCLDQPGAAIWGNPGQYVRENKVSCTVFVVLNQPMNFVLNEMQVYVRKPIIDRTGLQGKVSFAVDWTKPPYVSGQFYAAKSFQEFNKAMERVGLQVQENKVPLEYYVIERAEKPAEN
jgi:uncharacterized protein (TIGR03435 family)